MSTNVTELPETEISGRETFQSLKPQDQAQQIAFHFRKILQVLCIDVSVDGLKDTPMQVAEMYMKSLFTCPGTDNEPTITLLKNKFSYNEMVIVKAIPVYTYCERYFTPIAGELHIAYISKGDIITPPDLSQITEYFSKRPQTQERLTTDIAEYLKGLMNIKDVGTIIHAKHFTPSHFPGHVVITSSMHGEFLNETKRSELIALLKL